MEGETICSSGIGVSLLTRSWTIWLRCSEAEEIEVKGSPETISSMPVKGCEGSKSGGGVSDLSPETGNGVYGPGEKFMENRL